MNAGAESVRPAITTYHTAGARQLVRAHTAAIGLALLLSGIGLPLEAGKPVPRDRGPTARLRVAIEVGCKLAHADLEHMAAKLGAAAGVEDAPVVVRETVIGWRRHFVWNDGSEIRLERIAPRGQLRRVSAEYWGSLATGRRPELMALAGPDCTIRLGRRLIYEDQTSKAKALQILDGSLTPTGVTEPVNPAVPDGEDPGGVAVAVVDAGVNYLLPELNARLARDSKGKILGYDFWDLDDRPFDANPARSVFFPQRHGTRTASIILREAPAARLIPYRYPRPDMSRMTALVGNAAANGVLIVNLSMGSNKHEDWDAFTHAAKAHPDMLFVVSAGNNGRDIDQQPVYPAVLPLDNIITVTSAELTGELAQGSNSGVRAVDLLVPGENLTVTGFDGRPVRVSGSSYAAARISAMAARLLAHHPDWRAAELKAAIFARALTPMLDKSAHVSQGFIPDPDRADTRPVVRRDIPLESIGRHVLSANVVGSWYGYVSAGVTVLAVVLAFALIWLRLSNNALPLRTAMGPNTVRLVVWGSAILISVLIVTALLVGLSKRTAEQRFTHTLRPSFAYFEGTRWNLGELRPATAQAAKILGQCRILVADIDLHILRGPDTFLYFLDSTAKELVRRVALPKPTVYFVRDSLQKDAYDAEAIGKGNSNTRPTLIYTVWMTQDIADPGISLAHELIHILADSGDHVERPRNVMRADTSPENVELSSTQCEQIINTGEKNGLLRRLSSSPKPLPQGALFEFPARVGGGQERTEVG